MGQNRSPHNHRIPVEDFSPTGVDALDLYQKREKIYTRKVTGFYQRIRLYTGWPLLLGYFLLPWLNWYGHQAVLFDLPARQFHVLGITLWPQDFPLLAGLLILAALALFTATAWIGRVWCGYTCPQTVWTAIYMWAEQLCEGSRTQRIKRDRASWTIDKWLRKVAKHLLWLGFALLTGLTFVGYFSPMRELSVNLLLFQLNAWELLWVAMFTVATYINAGWLREQVCMYMCPYARLQSVMFDTDTLTVAYDTQRGEPRGSRKKSSKQAEHQLGDCVDCEICVQVCPTGIDIRNGLQYECINCALCIDACDSVMDQMHYPRGLIRYASENSLAGQPSKRFPRPRLMIYAGILLCVALLLAYSLLTRVPLGLDVIRDRNQFYTQSNDGFIENHYTLKILNMGQVLQHYHVTVAGLEGITLVGNYHIAIEPGGVTELPIRLQALPEALNQPVNTIFFTVHADNDKDLQAHSESRFIGPGI